MSYLEELNELMLEALPPGYTGMYAANDKVANPNGFVMGFDDGTANSTSFYTNNQKAANILNQPPATQYGPVIQPQVSNQQVQPVVPQVQQATPQVQSTTQQVNPQAQNQQNTQQVRNQNQQVSDITPQPEFENNPTPQQKQGIMGRINNLIRSNITDAKDKVKTKANNVKQFAKDEVQKAKDANVNAYNTKKIFAPMRGIAGAIANHADKSRLKNQVKADRASKNIDELQSQRKTMENYVNGDSSKLANVKDRLDVNINNSDKQKKLYDKFQRKANRREKIANFFNKFSGRSLNEILQLLDEDYNINWNNMEELCNILENKNNEATLLGICFALECLGLDTCYFDNEFNILSESYIDNTILELEEVEYFNESFDLDIYNDEYYLEKWFNEGVDLVLDLLLN